MMTEEQIIARLEAVRLDKPHPPKPTPVLKVAADRKLSVDGQRERVAREMGELIDAEKNRQLCIETHRQRQQRQREEGLYYRRLYEATAMAEYWAKQRDNPARHGEYDPIARYEDEVEGR
jgi:hypothetical protein